MSTHRGYATVVETLGETKKELDEELVNELKDKFTVIRFDEDMESVLPYVARIVSEMNNTSRISETYGEFKEAVNTAGEIQVQMVEADHPENPANLVFDNVTKKNQHIINFMAEHVLDENIQTLMKQVAIDYPRYDVPMKNESLVLVKSIMETGQTPQTAPQEPPIDEAFIDEIDESLSKYTTSDIFFERGAPDNWTPTIHGGDEMGKKVRAGDDSTWRNMTLAKDEDMNWEQFSSTGPKTKEDIAGWKAKKRAIAGQGVGKGKSVHTLQGKGVPESVGEADEAVLKLAGVYK